MPHNNKIETDVVVIGGGAAGHSAALAASESGARVIQLFKGPATTAISTGFLTFPVEPRFGGAAAREILAEHVGKGLSDRELLDCFIERAPIEIADVVARYQIQTDEAPRGLRAQLAKGRSGRDVTGEDYGLESGQDMTALVMEFSATHGTSLYSGLLKAVKASQIDRIKGTACRIDMEAGLVLAVIDGRFVQLTAPAVIMATGGVQGLYEFTDNHPSLMGDGIGMALEAGAAVTDLEFLQFYPLALAEPGAPTVFLYPDFPAGGRIVNDVGEDLLAKHFGGAQTLGDFANWDQLSVAMHREVLDGRTVFADFTRIAPGAWDENSLTRIFLGRYADKYTHEPVRVMPIAHYTIGGVQIDSNAETSVSGLYAVGEVAGGMHGANRHGGVSLAECVTFGRIAGRNAAARAGARRPVRRPKVAVQQAGAPFDAGEKMNALRRACQHALGPLRDGGRLARLGQILEQRAGEAEAFGWSDPDGYAALTGYRRALATADALRRFMERREESRGVHSRSDFPDPAGHWVKKQVMRRDGSGGFVFEDRVL